MVALVTSQEYSGQGDVLELAQVAEVIISRQSLLTRPVEGFPNLPWATHTRVLIAGIGRTFG